MRIIAETKAENELVKRLAEQYGATATMRENAYAVTMWCAADVKEKHDIISNERAEAFLEDYERRLAESSISGGWDFIEYADVTDYEEKITAIMIDDALFAGVIVPVLENDGLKAYVGEDWFFFGGSEFEHTEPSSIPCDVLVNEIKNTLDSFRETPEHQDDYLRYYHYIKENLAKA